MQGPNHPDSRSEVRPFRRDRDDYTRTERAAQRQAAWSRRPAELSTFGLQTATSSWTRVSAAFDVSRVSGCGSAGALRRGETLRDPLPRSPAASRANRATIHRLTTTSPPGSPRAIHSPGPHRSGRARSAQARRALDCSGSGPPQDDWRAPASAQIALRPSTAASTSSSTTLRSSTRGAWSWISGAGCRAGGATPASPLRPDRGNDSACDDHPARETVSTRSFSCWRAAQTLPRSTPGALTPPCLRLASQASPAASRK